MWITLFELTTLQLKRCTYAVLLRLSCWVRLGIVMVIFLIIGLNKKKKRKDFKLLPFQSVVIQIEFACEIKFVTNGSGIFYRSQLTLTFKFKVQLSLLNAGNSENFKLT